MNNKIKIAQIFDIADGAVDYSPSKASLYLKRFGVNMDEQYALDERCCIDASNFKNIENRYNQLIFDDSLGSYSGTGAMRSVEIDPLRSSSVMKYPIRCSLAAQYYFNFRVYSVDILGSLDIYIDQLLISNINIATVGSWTWVQLPFVIPDEDLHLLGISIKGDKIYIDKIYIDILPELQSGEGPPNDSCPYLTAHFNVYSLEPGYVPNQLLDVYDYKCSIGDMNIEDWYNFSMHPLTDSVAYNDNFYAMALTVTGSTSENFIIWDISDSDEYFGLPLLIKAQS